MTIRLESARLIGLCAVPLAGLLIGSRAKAQEPVELTREAVEMQGRVEGSESLTRLAARDRRRKICLGFSSDEPSHILEITQDQPRLRVAVDSEGEDTTLLIQGPRGIDCNDNYRRMHRDAAVTDSDWPAGTYQIWVGTFNRGDRIDYTLRISPPQAQRQFN